MKSHQASFLAHHGSPDQLHDLIDKNPGVYFPGMEENPSYNVTHLRREIDMHKDPSLPHGHTLHSPSLNKYTHTKEDVDSLLKIQKYQLAQTSPNFGPDHFKKMWDGASHQINAHTLKTIPFDEEMHRRLFANHGAGPKFKGFSDRKLFGLSQNKSLNHDAFEKLFALDGSDRVRANLIDSHPDKIKTEHIREVLSSSDNDDSRFALERNRLI